MAVELKPYKLRFPYIDTVEVVGQATMPDLNKLYKLALKSKTRKPDRLWIRGIWLDKSSRMVELNEWTEARNPTDKTIEVWLVDEFKWVRLKPFVVNGSEVGMRMISNLRSESAS